MPQRPPESLPFARRLRKDMTREERHLWYDFLRTYPIRFRRQEIMDAYIVDFYCYKAKLAVELDGSQHYDPEGKDYDARRTAHLQSYGIEILRFSNLGVQRNFAGVCLQIDKAVARRMGLAATPLGDDL